MDRPEDKEQPNNSSTGAGNNPSPSNDGSSSNTTTPPSSEQKPNEPVTQSPTSSGPVGPASSDSGQKPSYKSKFSFRTMIMLLAVGLIGILVFLGWFYQRNLTNESLAQPTQTPEAVQAGKMIVGLDATLPPMEYEENGNFVGYDIDLANYLAKEIGTEVEFKNIAFDDLFSELEANNINMIISAVTITDERLQKYDFSDEYLNAGQIIITQRSNETIKSTQDLKGKRIAVQKGTTNETEALKHTEENLVIRYPDFDQATKALVDGEVDAIFTDLPNAKGIITANPTLKISSDPFTNEYYGIVFRKGDPMKEQINGALRTLRVNGILTYLKQKWLD